MQAQVLLSEWAAPLQTPGPRPVTSPPLPQALGIVTGLETGLYAPQLPSRVATSALWDRGQKLPPPSAELSINWVNRHCQELSWTSHYAPDVPSACLGLPVSEEGPSGGWEKGRSCTFQSRATLPTPALGNSWP